MSTTITFTGNVATEPELRFTAGGTPVLELRVAVNHRRKTEPGWQDAEPTFHPVKIWGRRAENAAESLSTGDRINVHGHLETEAWNDKNTSEKRTKDVVVVTDRFGFIGADLRHATVTIRATKPANRETNASEDPAPADDPWATNQH
jgi:single-strand DNA-binding protein